MLRHHLFISCNHSFTCNHCLVDYFESGICIVYQFDNPALAWTIFPCPDQVWPVGYTYYKTAINPDNQNIIIIGGGLTNTAEFDPTTPECTVSLGKEPANDAASITNGDEIFHDTGKGACVKCHGLEGRGDGADNEKGLKDDWGFPVKPRILLEGWRYKRVADEPALAKAWQRR